MCGIVGIVAPDAARHETLVRRMIGSLRHRGPDGEGAHLFSGCALGHTRLSIIDPTGGAQPMLTSDSQTAVVFNGEIYGYKDLRDSLRNQYRFRTSSDTEVLLALYERDQESMLERLPGMFAFAIWDERRRQLFCARDRFGEKPFFYAFAPDGTFVFGSEIKAILASELIDPVIDPDSVAHYLQYLYVHPQRTIYRNVHVLPPAHRLVYRNGSIDVAPYWELPAPRPEVDVHEAVEEFRTRLSRAVARQLVADVPVGAFLSGGLDSSTLVALAAEQHDGCKTFSFGFGPAIDELPFARGIAERYRTDHTELSDHDSDIAQLLVRMTSVYDEPFADSSNIPTFLLCEQARRHVKVALTGEGADELVAGYTFWYRPLFEMEDASKRDAATRALARGIGAVCRRTGIVPPGWAHRVNRGALFGRQFATLGAAHTAHSSVFAPADLDALVPGGRQEVHRAEERSTCDTVDEILRSDLRTYLPGDILVKADRASMAHGLELRAPFLDWELASFCISLPSRLKITRDRDKAILRDAFAGAWTPAIRARGKQGFGAPIGDWLRRPTVRALKGDVLGSRRNRIYDLVSYDAAQPVIGGDDYRTWALLVLALWMESTAASGTWQPVLPQSVSA